MVSDLVCAQTGTLLCSLISLVTVSKESEELQPPVSVQLLISLLPIRPGLCLPTASGYTVCSSSVNHPQVNEGCVYKWEWNRRLKSFAETMLFISLKTWNGYIASYFPLKCLKCTCVCISTACAPTISAQFVSQRSKSIPKAVSTHRKTAGTSISWFIAAEVGIFRDKLYGLVHWILKILMSLCYHALIGETRCWSCLWYQQPLQTSDRARDKTVRCFDRRADNGLVSASAYLFFRIYLHWKWQTV